nr:WD repeat-containing protein 47-like [Cherax quadricarinatus]
MKKKEMLWKTPWKPPTHSRCYPTNALFKCRSIHAVYVFIDAGVEFLAVSPTKILSQPPQGIVVNSCIDWFRSCAWLLSCIYFLCFIECLFPFQSGNKDGDAKPRFLAVTSLEDVQAVRCAEFHPSGRFYAVGSNSKTLRICSYPKLSDLREDHVTYQPTVLFKRTKHHKGSIYCLAWSPLGDLVATGSNDKTVKLMRFNPDSCNMDGT